MWSFYTGNWPRSIALVNTPTACDFNCHKESDSRRNCYAATRAIVFSYLRNHMSVVRWNTYKDLTSLTNSSPRADSEQTSEYRGR
jgi:hypothetical protein